MRCDWMEKFAAPAWVKLIRKAVDAKDYDTAQRIASRVSDAGLSLRTVQPLETGSQAQAMLTAGKIPLFGGPQPGMSVTKFVKGDDIYGEGGELISNQAKSIMDNLMERDLLNRVLPEEYVPGVYGRHAQGASGIEFQEFLPGKVPVDEQRLIAEKLQKHIKKDPVAGYEDYKLWDVGGKGDHAGNIKTNLAGKPKVLDGRLDAPTAPTAKRIESSYTRGEQYAREQVEIATAKARDKVENLISSGKVTPEQGDKLLYDQLLKINRPSFFNKLRDAARTKELIESSHPLLSRLKRMDAGDTSVADDIVTNIVSEIREPKKVVEAVKAPKKPMKAIMVAPRRASKFKR